MPLLTFFSNEIVGTTWRASLLIVLVFALRPLLSRCLPPKALPWLWLVVAGKLLLFSAPAGWWSLYNLAALANIFAVSPAPTSPGPSVDTVVSAMPASPAILTSGQSWDWAGIMALVWLLGVALLAAAQIAACIRFHRHLAREGQLAGARWRHLLEECIEATGVKTTPLLIETNLVNSPAVIGMRHPQLLVPHGLLDQLEEEEVRLVFIHELSHLRRRDLRLLALFALTRTLYWFNPLVWLAERALRADCEAACDAEVLRLTSIAPSYGRTLLRLTRLSRGGTVSVLVAAISTNSNQTERRLQMIMRYRNSSRWMRIAALAVVAAIGALTLPNEVVAQQQPPVASPPSPSDADAGRAHLQQKLHSIIIDKVNFDKMDITDVIQFLAVKSKELDPDKEGVNFVIGDPANFPPEDHVHRAVTIVLENVPLDDLLGYIAQQTNLAYRVEEYAVYLRPAVDKSAPMNVRTFLVPPNFFKTTTPAPGNTGSKESDTVDVKGQLAGRGFLFPVGATATFLPLKEKVVVRDTPEQLDLIAKLFESK